VTTGGAKIVCFALEGKSESHRRAHRNRQHHRDDREIEGLKDENRVNELTLFLEVAVVRK